MSRRHLHLELTGNAVVLSDLGSTNGTFVDGVRVATPVVFRAGIEVRLGDTTLELLPDQDARRTMTQRDTTLVAIGGQLLPADGSEELDRDPVGVARDDSTRLDQGEHPLGRPDAEDSGTLTIVFSDIVSSTEHAIELGDIAWMDVLNAHNEIVRSHVEAWNGKVVKSQGDGFMLTFSSVRRALSCTVAVQRGLRGFSESRDDVVLRIRVGAHTGEAIVAGDDIFGRHVVIASRIAEIAQPDEILVSSVIREIASSRGDLRFGTERAVKLKGLGETQRVYPLLWEDM